MARRSADSLLNSLKGKIWLATSALAFLICTFGMLAYLLVSFIVSETFYAVFIPFLFLSFIVMIFGWWLSNEVVSPIEKVSLLAKSLERSASISLPKTSGSTETDELLQTLHRNSQQLQAIVFLMDKVASGNINVTLTPLQNSDRLTNSFQKLLSKVSESINAKTELERLQAEVQQITNEISRVRKGNLNADIQSDFPQTKEISETFRYLIGNLNVLLTELKKDSTQAKYAAVHVQKTIESIIREDEAKVQEMNQASFALKQLPNTVQKISEELSGSISSANQSIEKARKGTETAQENLEAVSGLRKQLQDAIRRIQRLNERSHEINKLAKTVEDLAQRTNLIALNASLQAVENQEAGQGFMVLAEEVERLSVRAENTNREISSLNKSISIEISEVENSLQATFKEAANLSKFAIETGDSLSELERYVGQFVNLQNKLAAYTGEQSVDTEKSFQIFIKSISLTERAVENLKDSTADIVHLSGLMEKLQFAVEGFELAEPVAEETTANGPLSEAKREETFSNFSDTFEPNVTA
ncbi:MAG: methyl-accepting chemotaxis protein [Pyrinomonadaceae bacterium]|nr:methyl-accepting chemotaxis protein [Pyrinomonadaceae bacterium]